MPAIPLSTSHHQRRDGLMTLRAINLYWDQKVGAMFARPAMWSYQVKGTGPNRGLFYESGLYNSDRFYMSGSQMFRESAIIGTHGGDDKVRFAGGLDGDLDCLIYCVGGVVFRYAGGVRSAVAMPDDRAITDVAWFGNRFLYFVADGRFYWSDIADPTSISGLSFATAEAKPDGLARAIVVGDRLYLIGFKTIEVWYLTQSLTAPFQPSTAATIDMGALSADAVLESKGRIYLVSDTRQIWLLAGELTQLADDSVLEAISTAPLDVISLAVVFIDGVEFLMVTSQATTTYVFNGSDWYRWHRHGAVSMNIAATLVRDGVTYAADMTTGDIFTMQPGQNADSDGFIERVASGYIAIAGGVTRCHAVALQSARGVGSLTITDPQVEMRYSDDGGNNYSDWMPKPLGKLGEYLTRPKWSALGMMRPFGRVFEFRCTADAAFTPQAFTVNDTRM